jgi:hypothetical protein
MDAACLTASSRLRLLLPSMEKSVPMQQPTISHFDKTLLQPTRLAAVAHLVACGGEASFAEIRVAASCASHALLWAHNQVLERAGYIKVRKLIVGHQVRTSLVLTDLGRRAFADHKAALAAITDHPTEDVA